MNSFMVNSNIKGLKIANLDLVIKSNFYPKNKLAIIEESEDGTTYQCVECSARFTEKEQLELHLVMHNKEYRFICGICGTGLKRKEHLERHTLGHKEVRPHVCPDCGKGFKRKEHLNIHKSIHSGDKTQICPLCQRSFYRKDHLMKHLQTHNRLFDEKNIRTLSDQETIELKQELEDEEDVKPIIDEDYTGLELQDEETLRPEVQVLTPGVPTPDRPFACNVCDKTYKRKDHLKLHRLSHIVKDKICTECGRGFHKEEHLIAHMHTHIQPQDDTEHPALTMMQETEEMNVDEYLKPYAYHEVQEVPGTEVPRYQEVSGTDVPRYQEVSEVLRPHECTICGRRFKRKQHLKVHLNVHTKIQPPTIWCALCSEGFQTNEQFEQHRCQERPAPARKENRPDYPPEFIDVSEAENSSYYSQQQEEQLPTPQRVYVCKYCSKPFKRKDHYKIHLHIHTGIKNFFCTDCGKGFYRKDHLQKHGLVHIKNKLLPKARKQVPALVPLSMARKTVRPEITITAPSNMKLRVPLQIKVPYQVVTSSDNGEPHSVTIDPQENK